MARIMLLDDDADAVSWMSAALAMRGHVTRGFTSAPEALAAVAEFRPDLVVADILMPEMDGLSFARLVRERNVPVLFVSLAKKEGEAILAGAAGFVRKPASAAEIRRAVDEILGAPGRRQTILVADDDPDVCAIYELFLESRFDVVTAENGKAALEALRSRSFALAIVDVHMPVMDGAELIRQVRADPALERLPVIVQTSDPIALAAPHWSTLRVARVMDKMAFADWLEQQLAERPAGAVSR